MADQFPLLVVVSENDARLVPYPYVCVNEDGTVRELRPTEREYLETAFHPCDGARPFVKQTYYARNGRGDIEGFCPRSAIPDRRTIADAPHDDPNPVRQPTSLRESLFESLRETFDRWNDNSLTAVAGRARAEFTRQGIGGMVDWIYSSNSIEIRVFRSGRFHHEDDWIMRIPAGAYKSDETGPSS